MNVKNVFKTQFQEQYVEMMELHIKIPVSCYVQVVRSQTWKQNQNVIDHVHVHQHVKMNVLSVERNHHHEWKKYVELMELHIQIPVS